MRTAVIILLAVICGYLIGNGLALKLNFRYLIFEEILMMINNFENLIRYKDLSVNELVLSAVKSGELKELTFLKDIPKIKGDFKTKWTKSVFGSDLKEYLSKDELNEISLIGSGLGKTDKNGQIGHLELHKEIIRKKLENAQKDKLEKSMMYRKIGTLAGLAVAIMIV